MKKTNLYLVTLLLLFMTWSCNKEKSDDLIPNSKVNTTKSSATIGSGHGLGMIPRTPGTASAGTPFNYATTQSFLSSHNMIPSFLVNTSSSTILKHPIVGDQGSFGSCVSWSAGYCAKGVLDLTFRNPGVDSNPGDRSGTFLYNLIINKESKYNCTDGGLFAADGVIYAKNYGVSSSSSHPTMFVPVCTSPSTSAIASATTDKIEDYASISNIADMKNALKLGLPVTFAFRYYSDFENAFINHTTWNTLNQPNTWAGHQVCIVGYDDTKNAFLLQNSWGTGGGDATYPGCVWVSYNVVTSLLNSGYLEMYTMWNSLKTDLAVSATSFPGTIFTVGSPTNGTKTYVFTVKNYGTASTSGLVRVNLGLPPGFNSVVTSANFGGGTVGINGGVLQLSTTTLIPAGTSSNITVQLTAVAAGSSGYITATIGPGDDVNSGNNVAVIGIATTN